jgi:hypothetical protein
MGDPKIIKIRFDKNKFDNASDSLTTYALMAVLAGSFFLQVIGLNVTDLFISSFDKVIVLFASVVSLFLILNAAEIVIDIFHFTEINGTAKNERKYKKQLKYYNLGVIFLITAFIYAFWSYLVKKAFCYLSAYLTFDLCSNHSCQYTLLIICGATTWYFVTLKWRKDLKFIKASVVQIEPTLSDE